jgi:hypothetical protein
MYNDAYMARVLVPAFMYEAVSLVDKYSLARAKRMAHSSNMDLDGYAVYFCSIFFLDYSLARAKRMAHSSNMDLDRYTVCLLY